MIPSNVFDEFVGKEVEVYAGYRSFRGLLTKVINVVLIVEPTNKYDIKKYGPVVIDMNRVTSIRRILPYASNLDEDDDSCEDAG